MPFFKSQETIGPCAESLLTQDGMDSDYEVIFVDNRSPDDSAAIVRRYDGITVLEESTPGAYAARNTGIRHAAGSIIAFTDADCTVDRTWLKAVVDGMGDPHVGVLLGHCRYPETSSRWLSWLAAYENAKTEYVLTHRNPAHRFAYCNNMAVRADLFDDLGPFLEWQRAGDSEWVHRMAARRPEMKVLFHPTMGITHFEFVRGRKRADRLRLYQKTNSQIPTFRELSPRQRLTILLAGLTGRLGRNDS